MAFLYGIFCFLILGAVGKIAKKPDCNAKLGEKPWESSVRNRPSIGQHLLGIFVGKVPHHHRCDLSPHKLRLNHESLRLQHLSNYQTIKYQSNINQYPTKVHRCPSLTPIKYQLGPAGKSWSLVKRVEISSMASPQGLTWSILADSPDSIRQYLHVHSLESTSQIYQALHFWWSKQFLLLKSVMSFW